MTANHESDGSVNSGDDVPLAERPDDDDHDLLTFGEAGARLIEEVARQERRVAALRESGASDDAVTSAERRLAALRAAQQRNRQPTLDELRTSGFFGTREG